MNRRAVKAFARRFREALERDGAATLERFDWSGGFFGLGFEMDCGHFYEGAYGFVEYRVHETDVPDAYMVVVS